MSEARHVILSKIRSAVRGKEPTPETAPEFNRPRPALPVSLQLKGEAAIEHYTAMAEAAFASVVRLPNRQAIVGAVADYLREQSLPMELQLSEDVILQGLDWQGIQALHDLRQADMPASLAVATAGILESGSVVMCSSPQSPTTLNYLPDHQIIVLPVSRLVGCKEDVFNHLLENGGLPRVVNFITGPSRTADIEQVIQLGAHGPRNLHILLLDHYSANR